ncbi:MAG: hypothetical protein WCV86_04775 [Patescibacteria group bacterium]|jgi:hypothetical protein
MFSLLQVSTIVNTASDAANGAGNFVTNVDWSTPTWDMFIVLFFVLAGFLYGLSLGRDRIIVILVSIYMALAVVTTAPYIGTVAADVGIDQIFVIRISTFVTTFIVLFLLLSRSALLRTVAANAENKGGFWHVMLFSFLHVGLLISITLSFLPKEAAETLAPLTQQMFATDTARFLWIVLPILAMVFIRTDGDKKYKYDL